MSGSRAFTLVELMIVVAILGILAAITLPEFQGHTQQAKEAAAKDNLRILREVIERFAIKNNGRTPGYAANGLGPPIDHAFYVDLLTNKYLPEIPTNPFNGLSTVQVIVDADSMPAAATGNYGWVYKPLTKEIRLDWTGTDSQGTSYYSY